MFINNKYESIKHEHIVEMHINILFKGLSEVYVFLGALPLLLLLLLFSTVARHQKKSKDQR